MAVNVGTLAFYCGKMAAGKTTAARALALQENAVLLSEDEWLESLYAGKIASLQDYVKYSARLKPQIKSLVQSVLATGTNVVMDYPANTPAQRQWFKEIYSEIQAPHRLILIRMSDEGCLAQLAKRRQQQPARAATDTVEMFAAVTGHFTEPSDAEGFSITLIE